MKIAFDLRRINNPGIGRYMKCLVQSVITRAPEHDYLLIVRAAEPGAMFVEAENLEIICANSPCYSIREQIEIPRLLQRHGVDLLHSPHFNMPLRRVCPSVVTIHDVIYLACPEDLPSRTGRLYYSAMMRGSARRADLILTDSEFSRRDIIRRLGCDPAKVEVVYPGVSANFTPMRDRKVAERVLSRYGVDEQFILYTGIYKRRKNHAGLLRAFRFFLHEGEKTKLVIAGPLGEGETDLKRLAAELRILNHVIFTGYVSDEDLPALYSAARVYACPSLYEGFGFTILEAMACGVPVVSSPESSLPEVGGDAPLYADARDPQKFADDLRRAFSDHELRRQMIESGFANLRRFSWTKTAERALVVYERVARVENDKLVCA